MKYELSPSILSADFARLGEEIKAVEQTGVNYLHIDVMDGMFVPSISFGFPIIKSIRKMSNMVFDVHLMVEQPERYIEETAASGRISSRSMQRLVNIRTVRSSRSISWERKPVLH